MKVTIDLTEEEVEFLFEELETMLYKKRKRMWYPMWKINEKIAIELDKQDGNVRATTTLCNKLEEAGMKVTRLY